MTSSDPRDPSTWRFATPIKRVPYRLLNRSGSFSEEGAKATEEYLIPADQLLEFALEVFPDPIEYLGLPLYATPWVYTGINTLKATNLSWDAFIDGLPTDPFEQDLNAPAGTYGDLIKCVVTYEPTPANSGKGDSGDGEQDINDPETFLEISGNATGEFINSTAAAGGWVEDKVTADGQGVGAVEKNKRATVPVTFVAPQIDWTVTWPRIPYRRFTGLIIDRLRARMGHVNSTPMTILYGSPVETILFMGFDIKYEYTWRPGFIGTPPLTLTCKFAEKHIVDGTGRVRGHNDFWKAGHGWQRFLHDPTDINSVTYQSSNLDAIFAPE